MNKNEVMNKLALIFREVFDDENLNINENSNADNVYGWDSLNHIYLVVAIEDYFNLKFTTEEINGWDNVGNMAEHIMNHV